MDRERPHNPWQPSQTDRYLEAMRRLSGKPHSARFPEIIRQEPNQSRGNTVKFTDARKSYRAASGTDYQVPDKAASYLRNAVWHLLDKSGALLAVVHPDGTVRHGQTLRAIMEQAAHRRRA